MRRGRRRQRSAKRISRRLSPGRNSKGGWRRTRRTKWPMPRSLEARLRASEPIGKVFGAEKIGTTKESLILILRLLKTIPCPGSGRNRNPKGEQKNETA